MPIVIRFLESFVRFAAARCAIYVRDNDYHSCTLAYGVGRYTLPLRIPILLMHKAPRHCLFQWNNRVRSAPLQKNSEQQRAKDARRRMEARAAKTEGNLHSESNRTGPAAPPSGPKLLHIPPRKKKPGASKRRKIQQHTPALNPHPPAHLIPYFFASASGRNARSISESPGSVIAMAEHRK